MQRHFIRIALTALFALGCFSAIRAGTLEEYRARLSRGLATIQQLQMHDADVPAADSTVSTAVAQLKSELPAHETIYSSGEALTVDNTWLHDALNNYSKAKSDAERNDGLLRIGERLLATIQRVDELKQSAEAKDKDAGKARLAAILRRPEYNKAPAEGSALQRLWDAIIRWVSKLFPRTKPLQPGSARMFSGVAQVLVIGVSIAAIAFVIWKFAPRYFRNRTKKKAKREARIVLGERLEPDQTASDLLAQADALAGAGDLRAAIRKAYVALLCELGDRKVISLAQHKTNRDYLAAIRSRPVLFGMMKNLTNSFEVHWYGFVPPVETDWNAFRQRYQQALTAGN